MRSTRRFCVPIAILAAWAALAPPAARSAQLEWIGGTDTSWHTPTNWAPIVIPGEDPIQRVPQDGDTVLISDTTHGGFIHLDADTARLGGLTVEGDLELITNDHLLQVANGGLGTTVIRGEGSWLGLVSTESNSLVFQTELLEVLQGGTFFLLDEATYSLRTAQVSHSAKVDASSQITGNGAVIFGIETTPPDTVLLRNEGTIRPAARREGTGGTLRILTQGGSVVDFNGETDLGVIDVDEPGSMWLEAYDVQALPYSGKLAIGEGDFLTGPEPMENVRIELNGGRMGRATLKGGSRQMLISGSSTIDVNSGTGFIDANSHASEFPYVQMTGGAVHVHVDASLQFTSSDQSGIHELSGSSFLMDDRSKLIVESYEYVRLSFEELDLDGDSDIGAELMVYGGLEIDAPAIDNDPASPGFDGTIRIFEGGLTANIPGGWTLTGRLEIGQATNVNGTTITVDGGQPEDGLYFYGLDFPTEVNADIVLTQNAHVEFINGPKVVFNGSISYLLRGDFNDNGQVEQGDLDLVLLNWGSDGTAPPATWTIDLPRGLIDQEELDNLLLHWGDDVSMFAGLPPEQGRAGPIGGVPEPGAVWLLLVLLLAGVVPKRWLRQASMP